MDDLDWFGGYPHFRKPLCNVRVTCQSTAPCTPWGRAMRLKLTHEEISAWKWDEESVRMSFAARVVSDCNIHEFAFWSKLDQGEESGPVSRSWVLSLVGSCKIFAVISQWSRHLQLEQKTWGLAPARMRRSTSRSWHLLAGWQLSAGLHCWS